MVQECYRPEVYSVKQKSIKCLSLNVCGLKSKLRGVELESLINRYDIIMLSETKLTDSNPCKFEIPGYKLIPKNRQKAKAASGGVAFIVREELLKEFEIIYGNCEFVLWMKSTCILEKDLLIGVVYIPPNNTAYSDIKMFDDLESDIISLTIGKECSTILLGDFNSRTGRMTDCLIVDNIISEALDFTDEMRQELFNEQAMYTNRIDPVRFSQDSTVDKYGGRLLNMCKSLNLYILNGRVGSDKGVGHVTCRDASLVDYVIASADMFEIVKTFEVLPFDPMVSDCHNPVTLSFNVSNNSLHGSNNKLNIVPDRNEPASNTVGCDPAPRRPKWNPDSKQLFLENINMDSVNGLENTLSLLEMNTDNIVPGEIDDIVNRICNLFCDSAKECGFIPLPSGKPNYQPKPYKRKQPMKPWFNANCEEKRKEYHKVKKKYNSSTSYENKEQLKSASKMYKRQVNREYRLYCKKLHQKIRMLKSTDPKEYWTIVKDIEKGNHNKTSDKISTSVFAEYFENLNKQDPLNAPNGCSEDDILASNIEVENSINAPFTPDEITRAIKTMKNNKASGFDAIINEYIKATSDIFLPIYVKLFNIVLTTGNIPSDWTIGIIRPIYKNKGNISDPDNYRGITILSCFGKLFTSVINSRLETFLNNAGYIGPEQAGFKKGFSTTDHIFLLHGLIELYLKKHKRMYCCFVDYKKAFDSINRIDLWRKVLNSGIKGRIFTVIFNLYKQAKSCVSTNGCLSAFFACSVGVRQGENLSPLLFSIFLNDLESFLSQHYDGLPLACKSIQDALSTDDIEIFVKLYIMLYADDTIIMSENPPSLQKALNGMYDYCIQNKLSINVSKTKIVIFSRGMVKKYPEFTFGDVKVEVSTDYTYLGVSFNYNGRFNKAITRLVNQGTRAMYSILSKSKQISLPLDIQVQLFDVMIMPILTYGSEVWGFQTVEEIEKTHLKYLKSILHLNKSTPNPMVYGELGCFPLRVYVNTRIIGFWGRLLTGLENKLSFIMYKAMLKLNSEDSGNFKWIENVKSILNNLGLSNVWETQSFPSLLWLKQCVLQRSKDQYTQLWFSQVAEGRKCINYRIFKSLFTIEPYLLILPDKLRIQLSRFRCRNSRIPIEMGARSNIPRAERKCTLCQQGEVGDEFHYIFCCTFFSEQRKQLINKYYWNNPSSLKMYHLFNSKRKALTNLSKFIVIISDQFKKKPTQQ
jgi:exonuclease III